LTITVLFHRIRRPLVSAIWLLLATACATPSLPPKARQPGLNLADLGEVRPGSGIAWAPDGSNLLAASRRGLELIDPAAATHRLLGRGRALCFAWAPGGRQMVVAWKIETGSRLQTLSFEGLPLANATVAGTVPFLAWTQQGPVGTRLQLTEYSFGGRYLLELLRWNGNGPPTLTPLRDVTLKPATLKAFGPFLQKSAIPALSPAGDELAFVEIHDPPAATPYGRLQIVRLGNENRQQIAKVPALWSPGFWLGDAETLVYADGEGNIRSAAPRLDPRKLTAVPKAALTAVSPSGRHLLVGATLFSDGREPLPLGPLTGAAFAPDGSQLAFVRGGHLLLLSGLPADPPPPLPADRRAWSNLRRWHASGLISTNDYRAMRKELLP
jgi:hypothetical protein